MENIIDGLLTALNGILRKEGAHFIIYTTDQACERKALPPDYRNARSTPGTKTGSAILTDPVKVIDP